LRYRNKPAVRGGNEITSSATAPVEFAFEILKMLDPFRPATLSAWLDSNTKKDAKYSYELMDSMMEDQDPQPGKWRLPDKEIRPQGTD
jgi:hypothetical protein